MHPGGPPPRNRVRLKWYNRSRPIKLSSFEKHSSATFVSAPGVAASIAERDILTTTLPNGMKVITEAMSHVRSVSVGVWIGTGSRRETPEQNGVSHFIEHMLFKGTATRSAEDIARSVDSLGGNLDAFTGKELV